MPTLEINNIPVDLGTKKIAWSKSAYPPGPDWLTKLLTRSLTVSLPRTQELDDIFLRPKDTSIRGSKFNKFVDFKYKDNSQLIQSGKGKLIDNSSDDDYNLLLNDSSVELFNNMKDDLTALELDSEDFVFNAAAYTTLKVLNSSVWLWCQASMHEKKTLPKNILFGELAYSRPFFSGKRLLEKIFSTNSWLYNLGIDTELIDTLIYSSNSNSFVFTSYEKEFDTTLGAGLIDLTSPDFIKTDTVTGSNTLNLNYKSNIRFRGYIDATEDMILRISGTSSSATDTLDQDFVINEGRFHYDLTSNDFETVDPTYDLQFSFVGSGSVTLEGFRLYTIIDESDFGAMSAKVFIDFKVKTYDNIPEISQKELFKHALINVSGFFTTDNFRKKININSMKNLGPMTAYDWTLKLNEESVNAVPLKGYGNINYFLYDNDDIKPSNLGRGSFSVDNPTLQDVKQLYNSIFAASNEVTITNSQIDLPVYDDTERINELNTIIGYYETVTDYTVARFANLNGNTIIKTYWTNFVSAIQKGEIIKAKFDLNKSDFFLFDFLHLIYLGNNFKSTFYVLDIQNYMEGEETTLILLKS